MLFNPLLRALREGRRAAKLAGVPKPTRHLLKQLSAGLAALEDTPSSFQHAILALLTSGAPNGFGYVVGALVPPGLGRDWGASCPGLVPGTVFGETAVEALVKVADLARQTNLAESPIPRFTTRMFSRLVTAFSRGAREVESGIPSGWSRLKIACQVVDGHASALTREEWTALDAPLTETQAPAAASFYTGLDAMTRVELLRFVEMVLDAADDALASREVVTAAPRPGDAFTAWAVRRLHTAARIARGTPVVEGARAELYREGPPPGSPGPARTWQDKGAILCAAGPNVKIEWLAPRRLWAITGLTLHNGSMSANVFTGAQLDRLVEDTFAMAVDLPEAAFFEVVTDDHERECVRLTMSAEGPRWRAIPQ